MANSLQAIVQKGQEAGAAEAATREKLLVLAQAVNGQFDLSKPAASIGRSPDQIRARILAICAMAEATTTEDDDLLPRSLFKGATKPLTDLVTHHQTLGSQIDALFNNGGPELSDANALTFRSKNGQVNQNLGATFLEIWNSSEAALLGLYGLRSVAFSGRSDLSNLTQALSRHLADIEGHNKRAAGFAKDAEAELAKITELLAQGRPSGDEIQRLKTEAEKDRKTLAEYANDGTTRITAIRTASEQADQLKTAVDSYKSTFDNFQQQLNQREETIKTGSERQTALLTGISESEKRIRELISQAESMLSGATVAGLASSFGKLRDDLSTELNRARNTFYISAVFLFLSVLPLALYIIPGLDQWASNFLNHSGAAVGQGPAAQTATPAQLSAQIFARALFLVPAFWFARFAAARHAQLFRLREHYAYKYSVASSVEGFKKQAEGYREEIAAATFFDLTFNPTERMEIRGGHDRVPNPAMEWVMNKIGATYDGMADQAKKKRSASPPEKQKEI